MKIAIVGNREYTNYKFVKDYMNNFLLNNNLKHSDIIICSGGARGVDSLAEKYAEEYSIPLNIYKAEWHDFTPPCKIKRNKHGKYNCLAGFNRNRKIVEFSDIIIAFWDGKSKGTENTIITADDLNKKYIIVEISTK